MTQTTVYRAHLDGFFDTFENLDDLRTWANDKIKRFNMHHVTLTIMRGYRKGEADYYPANRQTKEIYID